MSTLEDLFCSTENTNETYSQLCTIYKYTTGLSDAFISLSKQMQKQNKEIQELREQIGKLNEQSSMEREIEKEYGKQETKGSKRRIIQQVELSSVAPTLTPGKRQKRPLRQQLSQLSQQQQQQGWSGTSAGASAGASATSDD